jgi:hypothetical protein
LFLYLQFGTQSVSQYLPLPKSPRYTAIATPFFILMLALWLEMLWQTRKRSAAIVAALLVISSVPCIAFAIVANGERARNTVAAANILRDQHAETVYADFYSQRLLHLLLADNVHVVTWFHANRDWTAITALNQPVRARRTYVLVDNQQRKMYTSNYRLRVPQEIASLSPEWRPVWRHRAYADGSVERCVLQWVRDIAAAAPRNAVSARIERNVDDMLEGDDAVLYGASEVLQ